VAISLKSAVSHRLDFMPKWTSFAEMDIVNAEMDYYNAKMDLLCFSYP